MVNSTNFPKAKYTYTVLDQEAIVEFDGDHNYTVSAEGIVVVSGTYNINGNEITFIDEETKIPGLPTKVPGRYQWKIENDILLLIVVDDPVDGRSKAMVNPWKRIN